MKIVNYLQVSFWLLLILSVTGCKKNNERKPNFIIIYTDDQQFEGLGIYNSKIKTPNLDKAAAQSLQFTNAHVAFSLCSPSRAALLTGMYGSSNGVLGLGSALKPGIKTLSAYLQQAGYVTGLSGKWHIEQAPETLGFEFTSYFLSNGTYYGRRVIDEGDTIYPSIHVDEYGVERSIQFMEANANKDQPFFLFHCPQTPNMNGELIWDAKDSTINTYNIASMPVPANRLDSLLNKPAYLKNVRNRIQALKYGYPDSLAIQEHTRDYYAVISELDHFLGRIFRKIDELGIKDHTYIIFMSDNGWMLGDHGFTSKVLPYRTSTHVPCWIAGPGIEKGASHSLVSNLDFMPTILELAGLNIPTQVQGKSLVPVLHGVQENVREHFVYEGLGIYGNSRHNLAVMKDDFRYIVTYTDSSLQKVDYLELYNIRQDPLEMQNLAQEDEYQEIIAGMNENIAAFMQEILSH